MRYQGGLIPFRGMSLSPLISPTPDWKNTIWEFFFSLLTKEKKKIPLLVEAGRNLSGGLRRARGLIPPVHEKNPLLPLFLPSSLPASLDMIHAETAALATIFFSLHWRLPPGSPSTLRVHSLVVETGHPRAHQREERKRSEENLLRLFFTQNNNHKKKKPPPPHQVCPFSTAFAYLGHGNWGRRKLNSHKTS